MGMIFAVIGLFLFLILIIVAVAIGVNKEKTEKAEPSPMIHASGIYSVVRRSPREDTLKAKPTQEEMRKYLAGINEDINGLALSTEDKEKLAAEYAGRLESSIVEIERGDGSGAEFYYYDFDQPDPVCAKYLTKGQYVTREDIHKFAYLVPPFHLGCRCRIKRHSGGEKLRDTTKLGLRPLLNEKAPVPMLANWHTTLKP